MENIKLEMYNQFSEAINNRTNFILSDCLLKPSSKTHVLNTIGLELQALGYDIILVTEQVKEEHLATRYIDVESARQWFGMFYVDSKAIVIVDEYNSKSSRFEDFLVYCKSYKIPVVGFVY